MVDCHSVDKIQQTFLLYRLLTCSVNMVDFVTLWIKSNRVTTEMKAYEQFFPLMLFSIFFSTFEQE